MDIMDPQWPSREAERLSGSGHGRLNSYSPSRQTRVPPCAPVLCPLGASSRVRRHSHTRRHGVRPTAESASPNFTAAAKYRLRFAGPGLALDRYRRRCTGILLIFLRRRRTRFLGILCFSFRCPFAFTHSSTQPHVLSPAPRYLLGFRGRLALHLVVYRNAHHIRVRIIEADVEQKSAIDVEQKSAID